MHVMQLCAISCLMFLCISGMGFACIQIFGGSSRDTYTFCCTCCGVVYVLFWFLSSTEVYGNVLRILGPVILVN